MKITGRVATAGPEVELGEAAVLDGWLAGFRATFAAESEPRRDHDLAVLVLALLDLVAVTDPPINETLWGALHTAAGHYDTYGGRYAGYLDRFFDPATADVLGKLFATLGKFGVTVGGSSNPQVTPLGRWTLAQLRAALPKPIEPGLAAGELLARLVEFHDSVRAWDEMWPWRAGRSDPVAAREILAAAIGASPSERLLAAYLVEMWGEEALPLWQEAVDLPNIGIYARAVLALWDRGPDLDQADRTWMVVERAAAALADSGPDEALTLVLNGSDDLDFETRIDLIGRSGHPDAEAVARALIKFMTSGEPRSVDQVLQLKVALTGWRPPIWRRVLVPATIDLDDLHHLIRVLFNWDDDHLHAFTIGKRHYSNLLFNLEEMGDESEVRVRSAFSPEVKKIKYLYDFGANWEHEIVLERVLDRESGRLYPTCLAFSGDSPQEYPNYEDEDDESMVSDPFDLGEVNRRLTLRVEDEEL